MPSSCWQSMERGWSAPGTTYSPLSGKRMFVHCSHSATFPRMVMDCETVFTISPPSFQWTRNQKSKKLPSTYFHRIYHSIDVKKYRLFKIKHTGATMLTNLA